MWSIKIIGFIPNPQQIIYLLERIKPVQVKAFFSYCSIQAFYDAVLGRFSGLDELDFNVFVLGA